ncbi:MAG: SDR family NAD(P)-dependent oxidoreductase, partial [Lentisphaeria bacterium]|nr:SDR family NAD(P)-dependent oxidoreductase [Lentisphaeria bacterium]
MNKVALITGAARGIGYGVAMKLAEDGVDLAVMDMTPEESAAEAMGALRDEHGV